MQSEKIYAFKSTVPILLGYLAIGCAFGLIVQNTGYPWFLALAMSVLIYAGAGQYAAVGMYASGVDYFNIAVTTFLINSRHMVYGLSLLDKFKNTGIYKPYLIFGLTDETYGLLTVNNIPEELDKTKTYFYITFFDQLYWIVGGMVGFFLGAIIPFDFKGVEFALTSLFVVLLIEQWKNCSVKLPFCIAGMCAIFSIIVFGSKHMLISSFILSIIILIMLKRRVQRCLL